MPDGVTLFEGPIATEWFRLCVLKSGLGLEALGIGMSSRLNKASFYVKQWLGEEGVQWKGKVITERMRIPLPELTRLFDQAMDAWARNQGSDLSENIT